MSKYKAGDKFIIEIGHSIEIGPSTVTQLYGARYFIKGFNTLVFDDHGLDRLERFDADAKAKQGEIKVGDELQNELGERFVVMGFNDDGSVQALCGNGSFYYRAIKKYLTKTGRHYDIDSILEQLKGADDE